MKALISNQSPWLCRTTIFLMLAVSCSKQVAAPHLYPAGTPADSSETVSLDTPAIAKLFASLPIGHEQMQEVHDAASSSTDGGYDEEYTLERLINAPGCGVGQSTTKAGREYSLPLRDMLADYLGAGTKGGSQEEVEAFLNSLSESDLQIYWPYSEDWDGEELPIVTFDPGYGSEYNYGYRISRDKDGFHAVDSVYVDEQVAMKHPVWVINTNDDALYTPLDLFRPAQSASAKRLAAESVAVESVAVESATAESMAVESSTAQSASAENVTAQSVATESKSGSRTLYMKSFKMLRHYDSWFRGASEFFIKCGSVNGFSASTEAELKLYSPSVTDFLVVIRRKYLNMDMPFDAIILTDFTNQLENLTFLITEDDGGTQTSWKCSATVKIKSKSYGFDVEIPYNEKDDIVWRGQLSAGFFQKEDIVTGRFGDVMVTFALE